MTKDRQRARGRTWPAAVKNSRSGRRHCRPSSLSTQNGEFVLQHNDFQLFPVV
jgi:hypothetical protein